MSHILMQGIGTVLALGVALLWFVQDLTQKKHTILRDFAGHRAPAQARCTQRREAAVLA